MDIQEHPAMQEAQRRFREAESRRDAVRREFAVSLATSQTGRVTHHRPPSDLRPLLQEAERVLAEAQLAIDGFLLIAPELEEIEAQRQAARFATSDLQFHGFLEEINELTRLDRHTNARGERLPSTGDSERLVWLRAEVARIEDERRRA